MSNELVAVLQSISAKAHTFSWVGWLFLASLVISILIYFYNNCIGEERNYLGEIQREEEKLDKDVLDKEQRIETKQKIANLKVKHKRNENFLAAMWFCFVVFVIVACITLLVEVVLFFSMLVKDDEAYRIVNAYDTYTYKDENLSIEIKYFPTYKNDKWIFEPKFVIENISDKTIEHARIHDKKTGTKYDIDYLYKNDEEYIRFLAGNIDLETNPKDLPTLYDLEIIDLEFKD